MDERPTLSEEEMKEAKANGTCVLYADSKGREFCGKIFEVHKDRHNGIGCLVIADTRETGDGLKAIWVPQERMHRA